MGKIVVKVQEEKHLGEDKIYHLMIGVKEVYLYFKNDRNAKQYEGYYISEREFKSAMRGKTIRLQKENFIDIINPEEKISAWVERLQKQRKEFGNIRGERRGVNATVILSGVFLIGIVLLGIGFWRVQYKKNLAQRVVSTEGEVTSYTTARLQGKRYAQGYYDVHVKYQVDGVWYEGYNGTTATNQGVGAKVTVTYDPKNPAKIYVAEDMEWDPFKFFMIGGVIVLVSGALLGNEIHMKLMWKKKTVKNSKNMTLDKYFDGTIESGSYTESWIQEFDRNGEDIGMKLNDTLPNYHTRRKMDFNTLEKEIEQLNRIDLRANYNYTSYDRYCRLYNSIYENLLEMEKDGLISIESRSKGLGYLRELLTNDGPEYSYTVVFWEKNRSLRKYKIGVCVRGLPICKPVED